MEMTSKILEMDIESSKIKSDTTKLNERDSGINSEDSDSSEEFIFYFQRGKCPISVLKDFTVNLKCATVTETKSVSKDHEDNSPDGNWYLTKIQNNKNQHETQPHAYFLLPSKITSTAISSELPFKLSYKSYIKQKDKKCRKKYRNITCERRIQANARERTRVHTISAAYENLRRAIPSYSNLQKLSKLSVLRVAKAYILTLARLNNNMETESDKSIPPISSYFAVLTETINADGKLSKNRERIETLF